MAHASKSSSVLPNRLPARASRARHIVRDSLIALAVFTSISAMVGWTAMPKHPQRATDVLANGANPAQLVRSESFMPSSAVAVNSILPLPQLKARSRTTQMSRPLTVAILASMFAAIIAFNLWFLRHLGRVYASPRRGTGRRS